MSVGLAWNTYAIGKDNPKQSYVCCSSNEKARTSDFLSFFEKEGKKEKKEK